MTKSVCPIPELGPEAYARWRNSVLGSITERRELELILELLGDVTGQRVLDVGCEDGTLAVELSQRGAALKPVAPVAMAGESDVCT